MSPEQAQLNNLDIDTRSDIYSLGVLLYEMLTGSTPLEKARFKEAAWDEIRRIIREEDPPRPSTRLSSTGALPSLAACRQTEPVTLTKQLRGELDWIIMKALEKERTRRYETATGLARDVQRYLAGETVEACPPTLAYRLRKLLHKHRAAAMTAGSISLVLLVGVIVSTYELRKKNQGAGHVDTLKSLYDALDSVAFYQGKFAECRRLNEKALKIARADAELGPEHPVTAKIESGLAMVHSLL